MTTNSVALLVPGDPIRIDFHEVSFSSEAGAQFECTVDKGFSKPCSSPFKAKLKSGKGRGKKHTISIFAFDAAGNSSDPAKVSTRVIRKRKKK